MVFGSIALGMGAMRVPSPAAGMMTITFIAGCKYTSEGEGVQMERARAQDGVDLGLSQRVVPTSSVSTSFHLEGAGLAPPAFKRSPPIHRGTVV